ncbi:MAG: cell division protein FtsL [Pseudomonadota bacterium]|jgi:cell division protein FtsL
MSLLSRKVRGFRLIDLVGVGLLVALILGVYLAKTMAGNQRAEIAKVERQIKAETARIRLLKAEVAHLEQPGRIERLAVTYLKMAPVHAGAEATPEQLIDVAQAGPPPKAKPISPVAAMVDGEGITPGVPPPPPPGTGPMRVAEVAP